MSAKQFWLDALDEPGWEFGRHTMRNEALDLELWICNGVLCLEPFERRGPEFGVFAAWSIWRKAKRVRLAYYKKKLWDETLRAAEVKP